MGSPRLWIIGSLTVWMAIACAPQAFQKTPEAQNNLPNSCATGATCTTTGDSTTVTRTIQVPANARKVDVLVVDDNSRSMQPYQASMGNRMANFVQTLNNNGLDWQIGVVTTDMSGSSAKRGGYLIPFAGLNGISVINNNTPNGISAFISTIQMTIDSDPNTWGSGDSRGIYAAVAAVQRNQSNWMRPDAALAVIIMSNEDERKNGGQFYGMSLESGHDYPADLISAAGSKNLSVHSIIIKPGDSGCLAQQQTCTSVGTCGDGYYGNWYSQLSNLTGGVVGTICAADYASQLQTIGGAIATQTLSSYGLDCAPVNSKVTVLGVTPSNLQVSTSVSGNQLIFTPALPGGTTLNIQYQCAK